MTDIDHEHTQEIVCPHCGHEHCDSYETSKNEDGSSGKMECDECGKVFTWECRVSVTYCTEARP